MRPLVLALLLALALLLGACAAPSPTLTPSPTPLSPPPPTSEPTSPPLALPSIADLVAQAKPGVVAISTKVVEMTFFGPRESTPQGSGFVFDPRGYILTNNHVVEGAQRITVTMTDTRQFEAELMGRDPLTDLAVIKVKEASEYTALTLGDSEALRIGDWVVAIGNALALEGGPTVTVGVVGAKNRTVGPLPNGVYLQEMIQTDAAINPGNSGGPLINLRGEVVGISTAAIQQAEGIGFAIASDTALEVSEQLIQHGRVIWPWMGVFIQPITPQLAIERNLPVQEGVFIVGVAQDGPAALAGLRAGDVIVALAGRPTPDVKALGRVIRSRNIGDTVEATILRGGRELRLPVTLEEMPRP